MTDAMENLMKNLGVLLIAFIVSTGLARLLMADTFLMIGVGLYGAIVIAVLLALVIAFFIPVPLVGSGIGAFLGTFISLFAYSWMNPLLSWSFGAGFAILTAILAILFDYVAVQMTK